MVLSFMLSPNLLGLTSLLGRDHIAAASHSIAASICSSRRRSPRYHQLVEYYEWKLEKRYAKQLRPLVCLQQWALWYVLVLQLARALSVLQALSRTDRWAK